MATWLYGRFTDVIAGHLQLFWLVLVQNVVNGTSADKEAPQYGDAA